LTPTGQEFVPVDWEFYVLWRSGWGHPLSGGDGFSHFLGSERGCRLSDTWEKWMAPSILIGRLTTLTLSRIRISGPERFGRGWVSTEASREVLP